MPSFIKGRKSYPGTTGESDSSQSLDTDFKRIFLNIEGQVTKVCQRLIMLINPIAFSDEVIATRMK